MLLCITRYSRKMLKLPGIYNNRTSYSARKFTARENDDIAEENGARARCSIVVNPECSARHLHFYLFPTRSPFSAPAKFKEPLYLLSRERQRDRESARSTVSGTVVFHASDPRLWYWFDQIRPGDKKVDRTDANLASDFQELGRNYGHNSLGSLKSRLPSFCVS